jgi:hypothetical protein
MNCTDRDPVDYSQTDREVFQQVQAGVEDHQEGHPEDPWACCLAGISDQGHVGCSPKDLEACHEDWLAVLWGLLAELVWVLQAVSTSKFAEQHLAETCRDEYKEPVIR